MNVNGQIGTALTPAVKGLMLVNVGVWLIFQILLDGYGGLGLTRHLALVPGPVLFDFKIWQLLTYMFLHSLSIGHILFNMLMLWFVGIELEKKWGSRFFLGFYLFSGVGAALLYTISVGLFHALFGGSRGLLVPVVGASGAIYGLLLAYGVLFGERVIHFMMLFPMKAKVFVLVLGVVEFLSFLSSGVQGGEVAYLAHLGGLASGYVGLWMWSRWQKFQWSQKLRKRNHRLKLVVDNDDSSKGPRFWN